MKFFLKFLVNSDKKKISFYVYVYSNAISNLRASLSHFVGSLDCTKSKCARLGDVGRRDEACTHATGVGNV